jgi:excisionase family DNA binding protein
MPAKSQKQQPDYSQWPTKEQVAAALDCSTKTVEAFASQGKLQSARWRRPTGGPKISVYHPVDVENLRRERFPGTEPAFVMPAPVPDSPKPANDSEKSENVEENGIDDATADGDIILRMFRAWLNQEGPRHSQPGSQERAASQKLLETSQKSRKPEVPIQDRVYLTVREAAAYAGLPERHLRKLIASGEMLARKEGHTRVRRAELDKL